MYSTKLDFVKKKKKEALRTLAQSGRLGITPGGSNMTSSNPFLTSLEGNRTGQKSVQKHKNPFLVELGKHQEAGPSVQYPQNETQQPSSYAAAVQGRKAPNPSRQIPPTFITQGPASVKMGSVYLNQGKEWQPPSHLAQSMSVGLVQNQRSVHSSTTEQALLGVQSEMRDTSKVTSKHFTASKQQQKPASDPNCTSIHVKGIPSEYNNQNFLSDHFTKFGQVLGIQCNPAKLCATVTYKQKHDAAQAKKLGRQLPYGTSVQLFWSNIPAAVTLSSSTGANTGHSSVITVIPTSAPPSTSENAMLVSQKVVLPAAHPVPAKITTTRQHLKNEDKEYLPSDDGSDSDDVDFDEEGVAEGKDSVLIQKVEVGDKMDTIAKYAHHNYYLRSLDKPDSFPITTAPLPLLQGPPGPANSIRGVQGHQMYSIPDPNLPLLPVPKGGTAADFCEALEYRDQEIRKSLVKQKSISDATPILGTCPDMCPEKERYQREERRCLHLFEILPDSSPSQPQVNHAAAVKEYSGSAADKEEPLSHELRPTGVLCMTMDYLATCIMDIGEGRRAEWYDFLWNRTRAIRKDITIQHLCNKDCVGLVERCARFHILCAHLMYEEDLKSFDPKLNNDNLIKSLQTLKQFYADLQLKEGISCENEAEFCSYDVLLHLNDGDVLSTVQHYSNSVRDHIAVKFAVEVAFALDSNNFVKFFKLVSSATFLSACILHRYFSQVRAEAVRVLNHSHSTSSQPSTFPLSSVVKMLCFDDNNSAIQFLQNHGIEVRGSDVIFQKGKLDIQSSYPIGRSYALVDSKNNLSLGEVVYGSALPAVPVHVPYSSFVAGTQPPQLGSASSLSELLDAISTVVQVLSDDTTTEEVKCIVEECISEAESLVAAQSVCEDILDEVVLLLCKENVQNAILEAYRHMEYLREQNAIMDVAIEAVGSELLTNVVATECQQQCYEACIYEASISGVAGDVFEEILLDEVWQAASGVFQQERTKKKLELEALANEHLRRVLNKYWKMWYSVTCERQHVRKAALDFPTAASVSTLPQQLVHLLPMEKRRKLDLKHISSVGGPQKVSEQLRASCLKLGKQRCDLSAAIDLPSMLQEGLLIAQITDHSDACQSLKLCWQLIVSLPNQIGNTEDKQSIEWLRRKLSYCTSHGVSDQIAGVERISLSCNFIKHPALNATKKLEIVVKAITATHGCTSAIFYHQIQGTNAILLYVRKPNPEEPVEEFCDSIVKQFEVVAIHMECRKLPMLVMGTQSLENDFLAYWLKLRITLNSLLLDSKNAFISAMHFKLFNLATIGWSLQSENELCSGLQWLAQNYPRQPSIMHYPLKDFVEEGIMNHFISRVCADRDKRKAARLSSQPLSVLVELYNAVLDHLITVATTPVQGPLWPVDFSPPSFIQGEQPPAFWNNPEYLHLIREEIKKLKLPTPEMKHATVSEFLQYFSSLNLPGGDQLIVPILSREACPCIQWDQVMFLVVEQIFTHLHVDMWFTVDQNNQKEFAIPVSWLRAEVETNIQQIPRFIEQVDGPHPQRHWSDLCPPIPMPWTEHSGVLQASLNNEKESSKKFELLLKQWANEPLQLPEEDAVVQCPLLVADEVSSKWNSLDAALELLRMKLRTSRLQVLRDTIQLEDIVNQPSI